MPVSRGGARSARGARTASATSAGGSGATAPAPIGVLADGSPIRWPLVIVTPCDPQRTSPNTRLHWRTLAGRKKVQRKMVYAGCSVAGWPKVAVPIEISFLVRRPRRLDEDNIIASQKASVDMLVECLGLPNDGPDWVSIGWVRQETGHRWRGCEHVELWVNPR